MEVTLYSIGDGVITTDKDGRVEMVNTVAEELTGWKQADARGYPLSEIFDIFNEFTRKPCEDPVKKVLRSGKIVGLANHTILRAKDGQERVIVDSAAPIKDLVGEILGVVLVFRDVTDIREKEKEIEFLSYRDSLTGVYNRAYFTNKLKQFEKEEQFPITLILGDLDGLKLINDVFGYQTGDQVLMRLADIMKKSCRYSDIVSRWAGDEFAILLPRTTEEQAQIICERIKKACAEKDSTGMIISVSLGYASRLNNTEKWHDVIKRAEKNMYQSKLLSSKSYRGSVLSSIQN
ncbi:MAG: diguanylate cyclase, partial [Clostridiales bacterium]|nr:diguanylate cyclase [Clostridiales bacterium]